MNTPDAPTFRGIRYYPNAQADRQYFYWAERPMPETQAGGTPVLDVYDADTSATLSLQARWGPESDDLEALRGRLAEKEGVEVGTIRLSHAPFHVEQVRLLIAKEDGTEETLATSEGSGFPPYNALFNVQLTGAHREEVMSVLAGGTTRLLVRYEGTFRPEVTAKATVSGDVGRLVERMEAETSRAAVKERVQAAVREGRLQLEMAGDASEALKAHVREMAIDLFVSRLHERMQGAVETADTDRLTVEADVEEREGIPYQTATNVADWFERLPPEGHIHPVSGNRSEEEGSSKDVEGPPDASPEVRWKVPLEEVPVAEVSVSQGEVRRTIEPAAASPVRLLEADPEQPLRVRTTYEVGGPPFEADVDSTDGEGWTLAASDLGLAHVVVDARGRREAGAEDVRARVQYRPSGQGERDDRTLYFRHDDWKRDWYLVTRDRDLAGTLECEIVETGPDGTRTEQERTTQQAHIQL